MEALGIDLRLFLIQLFNFGLLFILLNWLLSKPISKMLSDRSGKIKDSLEAAAKADERSKEQEAELAKAKTESAAKLEQEMRDLKKQTDMTRAEMQRQAAAEIADMRAKAEADIKAEKSRLVSQVEAELKDVVMGATKALVAEEVSDSKAHSIIAQQIAELK